jgi:tetratricopeptide (TPR) repeat protein
MKEITLDLTSGQNQLSVKHKLLMVLGILVMCFVFYGNSIKNDYALDDEMVMVDNARVHRGIEGIPRLFREHYSTLGKASYGYRPITLVTFALEYEFFGESPQVSHLISILLYALCCMLMYFLLLRIFREYHWLFSALVVILFLIHPIHTEVVDNIKCRDELLAFMFALLSLRVFIKAADVLRPDDGSKSGIKEVIIACLLALAGVMLFLLGVLSKPSCIPFVAIIVLTLLYYTKVRKRSVLIAFIALGLVYTGIRFGFQSGIDATTERDVLFFENPMFTTNTLMFHGVLGKIPMAFYTMGYYLKLLVVPHPLAFYYGYSTVPIAGWGNIWAIFSMLLFLPWIGFTLWKIKSKKLWVYGSLCFFFSISMFTNFLVPAVGIIAERFVFEASFGFSIVVAWLIFRVTKTSPNLVQLQGDKLRSLVSAEGKIMWRASMLIIVLGLFALSLGKTTTRNGDWADKMTLFMHDIENVPNSAKAHALIAGSLAPELLGEVNPVRKQNKMDQIIYHYKACLAIYPDYYTTANNLGTIYFSHQGNYAAAKPYFEMAIAANPTYVEAHHNLGFSLEKLGDPNGAIDHYYHALGFGDHYYEAYGKLFLYLKDNSADDIVQTGRFRKGNTEAHFVFGRVYEQLGEQDLAMGHFQKVLEVERDYPLAWNKLSVGLARQQRFDEAMLHNRVGNLLFPTNPEYLLNLGNVYSYNGDIDRALLYFEEGYALQPNYELADHLFQHFRTEGDTVKSEEYRLEMERFKNP